MWIITAIVIGGLVAGIICIATADMKMLPTIWVGCIGMMICIIGLITLICSNFAYTEPAKETTYPIAAQNDTAYIIVTSDDSKVYWQGKDAYIAQSCYISDTFIHVDDAAVPSITIIECKYKNDVLKWLTFWGPDNEYHFTIPQNGIKFLNVQ
jgi:hypothetical protein